MKTFLFILSLSLSLSTTHSQTWIRQNPFPKLSQLYDVNFDGDIGLAVGSEGVIFTTTDAGLTWISRTAPPSATDITTAFVIPGTNGQTMLCGGNYLFISKDAGVTWSVTNNDLRNIFKIDQLPDGQWLAMGSEYGARSNNEGGFWDPFNYKGGNVTAGDFTTAQNGWIQFGGFGNNQVWVTTNGGLDWSLRDTTHFVNIIELDMLDDTLGFLSTEGNVYKTADGGYHWNSLGGIASTSITDLHVVNGVDLWACLNNGNVYYSITGGGGWTEYNPNLIPVNSSKGIYADESGRVWMAGNYVSILNSQDFGLSWRDQIPNYKGILVQPHFYNELIGIVAGSGGVLLKTVNSGTNWTEIHFPKEDHFLGAMMLTDQIMVVASSRGRVYYSNDQGLSWDTIGTDLGQITDLYALNPLHILTVTEEGIIYKTNDHGLHWDMVYDNGGNPLAGLDFYNNQYGWASGINGEIVTSDNQGDSWTLQPTPGNGSFSDIVFTTRNEGWACSSSLTDSLWFTLDGGQSWNTTMLPLKRFWREMSFNNPDTGWIAGGVAGDGVVLRTNDRGLTWTEDHHSPAMLLGIYAVPGKETVWAVGFGGNIVKFARCNFLPALADLSGLAAPCVGDTVTYQVVPTDVDVFQWELPPDWILYGNPNTDSIQVIVGNEPGQVSVRGSDACGHNTDTLSLEVAPEVVPEVIIAENNGTLICNIESGSFQWLLNGTPIPNANDQFYTPTESGVYELIYTVAGAGCEVRSNAITFTISATIDRDRDKVLIYPVPARDRLFIQSTDPTLNFRDCLYSIFDPEGRIVQESTLTSGSIQIPNLSPGLYFVKIDLKRRSIYREIVIN